MKMTNKKVFSDSLVLIIATLFILNSPQTLTSAEKQEPYEAVNKFCSQIKVIEEGLFCSITLKSDPRSATAKNNTDLLFIWDDLAIKKLNHTRDYLANSYKKEGPKSKLKECLNAYDLGIMELHILPGDLKAEPRMASYDALLASDALNKCKDSLEKHKITDPYVLRQHHLDLEYVKLCVEISMTVV